MSGSTHVMLTGAFGNVGAQTVKALLAKGYRVTAFDVHSEHNDKVQAELARELTFETVWGDLTDADGVKATVERLEPDAIVHVAAIIAPTAYVIPDKARAVNVDGTRHLLEAAEALGTDPRFIFTSSYSVHGPRNPHRGLPPLTGDSPVAPGDNYGCHKVLGEKMVRASSLPWTIIRLPAVWSVDPEFGSAPEFLKFGYLLPPQRNEHAIDVRDAATAFANAIEADCVGRTFDIAGGAGWTASAGELQAKLYEAKGLAPPPIEAYRMADPDVDESWYFEDFVDTTESQRVLQYQNHTPEQYHDDIRVTGMRRLAMKLLGPVIRKKILEPSPYYGKPRTPDPTPMKLVIVEAFGLDPALAECPDAADEVSSPG
jgi:nucleoside-diphosphate-sugar epimerase